MTDKTTISSDIEKSPGSGESQATSSERTPNGTFHKLYIQAYLENPKAGKKAAIIKAGYVGKYAAQEAHRIHKIVAPDLAKLRAQQMAHLDTLAIDQLTKILETPANEVGYSNMHAVCKTAMEYSGNKPTEKIEHSHEYSSIEEINQEREQIAQQLAEFHEVKH